jgi:hypothetical protein
MNRMGQVFTFLILFFSVVFMTLAVTVFATHRNWRDEVLKPGGLKAQVEKVNADNVQVKQELDGALDRLANEQASRLYALASLQTKLDQAQLQYQQGQKQLADLQAAHGRIVTTLESNQETVKSMTDELTKLRGTLKDALQARDEKFDQVVQLTDQLNELQGVLEILQEREKQLTDQKSRMKELLAQHGLDESTPLGDVPPVVDGVVTAVSEKDFIEISIGSDDGLRQGHTLEVFRNSSYLGRVKIIRTEPDKAVAQILREYRKGTIRKGDRVATKFS